MDYSTNMNPMHIACDGDVNKVTVPFKNGYSGIGLLMSMAGDYNRNISDTGRSHDSNSRETNGSALGVNPNHASQLLMAAASVVTNTKPVNGLMTYPPEKPIPNSGKTINAPVMLEDPAQHTSAPASSDVSTTVSFASQSKMSTGLVNTPNLHPEFVDKTLTTSGHCSGAVAHHRDPEHMVNNSGISQVPQAETPSRPTIAVPFLWRRTKIEEAVEYHSPSGEILKSLEEVKKYLLSDETCKCGLTCPFHVEKVFNFDTAFDCKMWELADIDSYNESSYKTCCHRKHIRSNALAKQCKTVPKPVKATPPKRRAASKNVRRTVNKKSSLVRSGYPTKKVCDMLAEKNERTTPVTSITSRVTPIPPIETMMRTPIPDASLLTHHSPQGVLSPRERAELMSPRVPMLSPHAVSPSGSGHMVPVIAHTGYPPHFNSHIPPQPIYRPPSEPGYNQMIPGMPQHHLYPSSYDLVQNPVRAWNPAVHPMPPPAGVHLTPPGWQVRQEPGMPGVSRKRARRASSRSSNGGNSDTGYTSGLSSPVLASPGRHKAPDRAENSQLPQPTAEEASKSPPTQPSPTTKYTDTTSSASLTVSTNTEVTKSNSVIVSNTSPGVNLNRDMTLVRMPEQKFMQRLPPRPMHPYAIPNGGSMGVQYMDPMYLTHHQLNQVYHHPAAQSKLPPMHLPGAPYNNYPPHNPTQVMRGVYARPPSSGPPSKTSTVQPTVQVKGVDNDDKTSNTVTTSETKTDKSAVNTNLGDKDESNAKSVSVEKPNKTQAEKSPSSTSMSQSTNDSPSVNGGQVQPNSQCSNVPPFYHGPVPPGMRAIPSQFSGRLPPGMGREFYPPQHPTHQAPVQMMRAPNGQMFYRYAQPRMPFPPHGYPTYSPMYPQQYLQGPPPNVHQDYQPVTTVSPKRKRRKISAKTVIESHSAIMTGTDNSAPTSQNSTDKATSETG